MKIISFKKLKDNRYKLKIEEKEDILLYDDIILKYNLLITKEIEENELEKIKTENTSLECYYKAIKYLACKNRSKKEIENYLKRYEFNKEEIENTIRRLEEQNYLNEDNYLQSYINDQINLTNNGPQKIIRKLVELGFEKEKVEKYLDKIDNQTWQEKIKKIVKKKIAANQKDGKKKVKERILYSCITDGFKKEDIVEILEQEEIPENKIALEKEAKKYWLKLSRKYSGNELLYQLKGKLLARGFEWNSVEEVINNYKIFEN